MFGVAASVCSQRGSSRSQSTVARLRNRLQCEMYGVRDGSCQRLPAF